MTGKRITLMMEDGRREMVKLSPSMYKKVEGDFSCLEKVLLEGEDSGGFLSGGGLEGVRGTCQIPGGPGEKGMKG